MFGLLAILFLVVPIVELYVIVQVAQQLGVLETIAILIGVSILGAWLVKHQGIAIWRRAQREIASGSMPDKSLLDGLLVLMGGALLLTPGFVTDAVGLLAVFPPTRTLMRTGLRRRFAGRIRVESVAGPGFAGRRRGGDGDVIDVDEVDLRREDPDIGARPARLPGDERT